MKTVNPWREIPASDYEAHMSSPNVKQQQFLNDVFKTLLDEYKPKRIAFLGCSTGNGFEHIMDEEIVGIDLNSEFIGIAQKRFNGRANIQFINGDLTEEDFPHESYDLVHSALVFEYVDIPKTMNHISKYISDKGRLSVVLQLPSENHSFVSKTGFKSLESLAAIGKEVGPDEFGRLMESYSLSEESGKTITLESGKSFYVGVFIKNT